MPLIRFFDVFAGIGGFRSGLEKAGGFECVGYCEIDKYAKAAYEAIYDTRGEVYYEDIRKIDPKKLPDFDCICGGFPCQSYPEKWNIPKHFRKARSIDDLLKKLRNNNFGYYLDIELNLCYDIT